jgi:DNA polymerase-3 subunit gamma/tau
MAKRKPSSPPADLLSERPSAPAPVDPTRPPAAEHYTVLARRYRPQQFADVIGQEPVVRALINALESGRVAHAYLFTGARGVGKTSTARILAKALNCVKGPTATPCNTCEICERIASGEDQDVLEIDGASNRGIDEVREIRQNVQYRPSRARYKIYIVDEVHMLTPPAFNALLKTLEEPPAHVKFIFATTEVQRIPVTILSRCQRFDFAGIGTARIVEHLREVLRQERMQADDDALELIARRAGGSMRDAQSLLDQLLAFGGERLTSDQVHDLLGTAHEDRVIGLASAVLERDARRALELLSEAAGQGLQLQELLDQLLDYWRDLMVVQCAGVEARDLSLAPRYREILDKQAASRPLDTLLAGLDILASTKARLRTSGHGRILLEMALVRLSRLEDLVPLTQLAQWLEPAQSAALGPSGRSAPSAVRSGPPPVAPPEGAKKKLTADPETGPRLLTIESLPGIWEEVLRRVGPMLASNLEKAGLPASPAPNALVLHFPVDYNGPREHCQQPNNVGRVERVLQELTGRACQVRIEAAGGPPRPTPVAEETEGSPSRYRRQRSEAMKEPLIKRAMEVLGAQLVDVDEGFGSAAPAEQAAPSDTEEP